MEEKNKKISISTILLIISIIALIVMGVFIYKLNNDKNAEIQKSTELQAKVADLNTTVSELQGKINSISETINSNNLNEIQNNSNEVQNTSNKSSNDNSKDYEDIILNGTYAFPNSDVSYSFSKNGEATFDTNPASSSGTYKTTGKNSVEAHYTQSEVFNDETNKNEIIDIDKYEHFFVDDDRNVFWINPNGEKEKLEVLGEVDKNN